MSNFPQYWHTVAVMLALVGLVSNLWAVALRTDRAPRDSWAVLGHTIGYAVSAAALFFLLR